MGVFRTIAMSKKLSVTPCCLAGYNYKNHTVCMHEFKTAELAAHYCTCSKKGLVVPGLGALR